MELRQLHVVVPAVLVEKVYDQAAAEGKTMAELVTEILTAQLDQGRATAEDPPAPKKPRGRARNATG